MSTPTGSVITGSPEITVLRNEDDEFVGFEGDPDEVPEHARSNPGALITGRNGFQFDTPVWGHADTFMEMEEAGLLQLQPTHAVEFGPHRVFVYVTAEGL